MARIRKFPVAGRSSSPVDRLLIGGLRMEQIPLRAVKDLSDPVVMYPSDPWI